MMRDKDSHLISEAYHLVRESLVRTCMDCEKEFNIPRNPKASHSYCRRHAKSFFDVMANQFKYSPEKYKEKIDKLNTAPDSDFPPDLAQQPAHKALPITEAKAIGKSSPPPYLNSGDGDGEIDIAAKTPFTAYSHVLQTNKHHPKLFHAVLGSPYEKLYKQHLKIKD